MGRRKIDTSQLIKAKKTLTKVFNQRKDGIMKKAFELSTLCDIPVGVIIYGPNDDSPLVWPKEPESLNSILRRYQTTNIEERRKGAKGLSCFVKKVDGNAHESDEVKPQIPIGDEKFDYYSVDQLVDIACCLDNKIEAVKAKINALRNNQFIIPQPKFEEVQSYGGGVQQFQEGMMIKNDNKVILPDFNQFPVTDNSAQFLERLRFEEDLMMEMNNCGGYCNNLSKTGTSFDSGLPYPSCPNTNTREVMGTPLSSVSYPLFDNNVPTSFFNNTQISHFPTPWLYPFLNSPSMSQCNLNYNNNNNVDVGDYTGFMEGNFNGAELDQLPFTSRHCDYFNLMSQQAQLPSNYNLVNF